MTETIFCPHDVVCPVWEKMAQELTRLCAENERLRAALHYYADFHENPNDGPWGLNSDDYGRKARAALLNSDDFQIFC